MYTNRTLWTVKCVLLIRVPLHVVYFRNKRFHFSCFLSSPPHTDQDPESRESILEGLPAKTDTFSLDAGKLPKIRSSRPSATFNSYLINPEQVPIK